MVGTLYTQFIFIRTSNVIRCGTANSTPLVGVGLRSASSTTRRTMEQKQICTNRSNNFKDLLLYIEATLRDLADTLDDLQTVKMLIQAEIALSRGGADENTTH